MSRQALGIIETEGLAAAIEAADAAVKSAQVELVGYELTRGNGMTTVKITGNVSAVKAAIDTARIAAARVNRVCGYKVIARMAEGLDMLVYNEKTVGFKAVKECEGFEKENENMERMIEVLEPESVLDEKDESEQEEECNEENPLEEGPKTELCNLCRDPVCPRKKGDLKINCIHYDHKKKEEK